MTQTATYYRAPLKGHTRLDGSPIMVHRCANPDCASYRQDAGCLEKIQRTCAAKQWRRGWCAEHNAPQPPTST